jgi:hypothetical protein
VSPCDLDHHRHVDGPGAQLIHGVMEQNWIFHFMAEALAIASPRKQVGY